MYIGYVCHVVLIVSLGVGVFDVCAEKQSSDTQADVIERSKRATVGVLQTDAVQHEEHGYGVPVKIRGTGIHLGNGVILTARHAVEHPEGGEVGVPEEIHILTDDLRKLSAIRQGANVYLDVAVYQLQGDEADWPASAVQFGEQDVSYGDSVYTVGYPMGRGPALSFGKVGNPNTFLPTVQSRLVQVDLSACRGNSGGGLLNMDGQVVGLIHAIIQTENLQAERGCSRFGFALPGRLVKRVVNAVLDGQAPGFSILGIQLETIRQGSRWVLGIAKATGPSRHAGFRKGDILLAIDDLDITTPAQLKNYLIERTQPGQTVALQIQRGEEERIISVILGRQ